MLNEAHHIFFGRGSNDLLPMLLGSTDFPISFQDIIQGWTVVLSVVDQVRHLEFLRVWLLFKSGLGLVVELKVFLVILDNVKEIIIIDRVANGKIFRYS